MFGIIKRLNRYLWEKSTFGISHVCNTRNNYTFTFIHIQTITVSVYFLSVFIILALTGCLAIITIIVIQDRRPTELVVSESGSIDSWSVTPQPPQHSTASIAESRPTKNIIVTLEGISSPDTRRVIRSQQTTYKPRSVPALVYHTTAPPSLAVSGKDDERPIINNKAVEKLSSFTTTSVPTSVSASLGMSVSSTPEAPIKSMIHRNLGDSHVTTSSGRLTRSISDILASSAAYKIPSVKPPSIADEGVTVASRLITGTRTSHVSTVNPVSQSQKPTMTSRADVRAAEELTTAVPVLADVLARTVCTHGVAANVHRRLNTLSSIARRAKDKTSEASEVE